MPCRAQPGKHRARLAAAAGPDVFGPGRRLGGTRRAAYRARGAGMVGSPACPEDPRRRIHGADGPRRVRAAERSALLLESGNLPQGHAHDAPTAAAPLPRGTPRGSVDGDGVGGGPGTEGVGGAGSAGARRRLPRPLGEPGTVPVPAGQHTGAAAHRRGRAPPSLPGSPAGADPRLPRPPGATDHPARRRPSCPSRPPLRSRGMPTGWSWKRSAGQCPTSAPRHWWAARCGAP